jgi:hypothetical protein
MTPIDVVEREMSETEFARETAGFEEHAAEHGNPPDRSERVGFVALDNWYTSGHGRVGLRKALLR